MMTRSKRWALVALVAFTMAARDSGAADLGPHGAGGVDNVCRTCHNTAQGNPTLRGWAGGSLPNIAGTAWAGRTISSLCYMCHTAGGGGYSATNQTSNAYATGSHSFTVSEVPEEPEGSTQGSHFRAVSASTLPYAKGAGIECTSCHNVHRPLDRPFLNRATAAALCDECHQGRLNAAPLRGTGNTFGGGARSFSTHPTGQALADTPRARIKGVSAVDAALKTATPAAWALGGHLGDAGGDTGTMSCQTCHAVHGPAAGTPGMTDLLAIDNTTAPGAGTPSRLCEGCHYGGSAGLQVGIVSPQAGLPAGQWSDHPIDAAENRVFYPTGVALPSTWLKDNTANNDRGAQPLYVAASVTKGPVCSSCHDLHGGIAGTPLLRSPQPTGTPQDPYDDANWCFACHSLAQALPSAHHSTKGNLAVALGDAITSQLGCGDCHGPAGTTDWKAHNGFWAWPSSPTDYTYSAVSGAFCMACHLGTDPTDLVAPALKGQTFTETGTVFPRTHGTVRGTGSHYLGPDSNEFPGVAAKLTAWTSTYFSSYGSPNTGGGGNVAPTAAGEVICQSCHNVLYNDGKANPAHYGGSAEVNKAGWRSNLLLEWYEDDSPGIAQAGSAVGSALCTGCHDPLTGAHHPLTGNPVPLAGGRTLITSGLTCLADATTAPNTLSYPAVNALDCDSCHRPHRADSDSDVAGAAHGAKTSADGRPTRHILEVDGTGHVYTAICPSCHLK
jgi:predicted CXXCH cytochrome family protein